MWRNWLASLRCLSDLYVKGATNKIVPCVNIQQNEWIRHVGKLWQPGDFPGKQVGRG